LNFHYLKISYYQSNLIVLGKAVSIPLFLKDIPLPPVS
jgi:hypothetical protein